MVRLAAPLDDCSVLSIDDGPSVFPADKTTDVAQHWRTSSYVSYDPICHVTIPTDAVNTMSDSTDTIHVLHVDDEPNLADVAATFLEREDDRIQVETATSANEGLELLAEDTVDCIVSDYDMLGKNGIEFLEAVREDHPDVPFVLFTGKGSEEIASHAISAGVSDYLQKGVGPDQYVVLANRIKNLVSRQRAQCLGEQSPAADLKRALAALGDEGHSGDREEVSPVRQFLETLETQEGTAEHQQRRDQPGHEKTDRNGRRHQDGRVDHRPTGDSPDHG